jgi:hypothetical protein
MEGDPINTQHLYANLKNWSSVTYELVWKKWLWNTDCNALPIDQCWDMNEMHVYGILCALQEASCPSSNAIQCKTSELFPEDEFEDLAIIHLHEEKAIEDYSLRELLDELECLQLNWGKIIGALMEIHKLDLALYTLKACLGRLGQIAHHAYIMEGQVLDDPQHITPLPDLILCGEQRQQYAVISRKCLRQSICVLFALFRVHFIVNTVTFIPSIDKNLIDNIIMAFKQHHVEASMDFFNLFQQMIYLAPGMRLVYRTNFAGMYNDVSQVIYFHYPRFCRQPQLNLKEIAESNIHLLPLVSQMLPDIPIFYDDDTYIPGLCAEAMKKCVKITTNTGEAAVKPKSDLKEEDFSLLQTSTTQMEKKDQHTEWCWLVSCGEIFLIHNAGADKKVYLSSSHSLVELIAFFLVSTKRKVGDEMLTADEMMLQRHNLALTPHGHLQILDVV